jgi:uncharacterized protein
MEKIEKLESILRGMDGFLVAFSGGVDSTLLLYVSGKILGDRVAAGTVVTPFQTEKELAGARKTADLLNVHHIVRELDVLSMPEVSSNPPERCYHCKMAVFGLLEAEASRLGFAGVADATHTDDLRDYRPGLKALEELGIRSPFLEAGFTKEDIRRYSQTFNLPGADKPPGPCLATRIPYGRPINMAALQRVGSAEEFLSRRGFSDYRVRDHFPVAVIEVPESEVELAVSLPLRGEISRHLKELGYKYVTLDMEGFRSGSQNEVLEEAKRVKREK